MVVLFAHSWPQIIGIYPTNAELFFTNAAGQT